MIIGLSGYAQSGKDTVADILTAKYGYKRVAFADPIRKLLYELNPHLSKHHSLQEFVDEYGWDIAKKTSEVRSLLQNLGVAARKVIGESVWVDAAFHQMNGSCNYVITDVRFENEADKVREFGGEVWRVKRPGVEAVNGHISEHALDGYKVDRILSNGGTLEELAFLVQSRMGSLVHAD
jgi:hypothetical protein